MKQNAQSIDGLRHDGCMVLMGVSAEPISFFAPSLLFKQATLKGSMQNHRADLVDVLELAAAGKVKPILESYPLDDINKAVARLEEGAVRYRAVVRVTA